MDIKTCQYCGAAIPQDAETCVMCGSPTTPPTATPPPPATEPLEPPAEPQPEVFEPEVEEPEVISPPAPEQAPEEVIKIPKFEQSRSNAWFAPVIEILAGLIGFLGIGWIVAGKVATGILVLIGYWFFLLGYAILLFTQIDATNGWSLAAFCCVPVFPLISGLILYLRTK